MTNVKVKVISGTVNDSIVGDELELSTNDFERLSKAGFVEKVQTQRKATTTKNTRSKIAPKADEKVEDEK